jgi:hypothetical protein
VKLVDKMRSNYDCRVMPKFVSALTPELREFIAKQHMFFTATAPLSRDGRVNLSPKGMDTFRVLSDHEVAYLDFTGSGNETAAHVLENGRITIMFCSYEGKPLIMRLYGQGESIYPPHDGNGRAKRTAQRSWESLIGLFDPLPVGVRQIVLVCIKSVQTSCGFGVPLYEFKGHRDLMIKWCEKKGEESLREYRQKKNRVSIDGLATGLPA